MKKTALILPFLLATVPSATDAPFVKPATWGAYLHDLEKGTDKNLPPKIEDVAAKDWMGLTWTEFKGAKLRIAVMPVENKAAQATPANLPAALAAAYGAQFANIPVAGIEALLGSSLSGTGRFRLLERKALETIQGEKNLQASTAFAQVQTAGAASGNPADQVAALQAAAAAGQNLNKPALAGAANARQTAKTMGAQYLVMASVVEWTPDKSKTKVGGGVASFGGGGGLLGGLSALAGGLSKSEAEVAMAFRIVDSGTGEVKWQIDERATAGNWGFCLFGGGAGAGGGRGGRRWDAGEVPRKLRGQGLHQQGGLPDRPDPQGSALGRFGHEGLRRQGLHQRRQGHRPGSRNGPERPVRRRGPEGSDHRRGARRRDRARRPDHHHRGA